MKILGSAVSRLVVALFATSITACIYENEPPRRLAPEPRLSASEAAPLPPPTAIGPTEERAPSAPMLVEVDADQTMEAVGGEGVGVFIEYFKGGHWHIWWTCDTAQTRQSCAFSVSAEVASGAVSNVDASGLPSERPPTSTPSRVEVTTTTATEIHGIRFDTDPGAIVTVNAAVGGFTDGSFFFFVQDGKVNGGFVGKLTNPLKLKGNVP